MRVGGARPPPLITFTLTSKVAVYAPAEWADTLTLFHLYQYMYSVSNTSSHILPQPYFPVDKIFNDDITGLTGISSLASAFIIVKFFYSEFFKTYFLCFFVCRFTDGRRSIVLSIEIG